MKYQKAKDYLSSLLKERWEKGEDAGALAAVAAAHGRSLDPRKLPEGLTISSPVRRYQRGLNGKRPKYVVKGLNDQLYPARGTHFGSHSWFQVYNEVMSVEPRWHWTGLEGEKRDTPLANIPLSPLEETYFLAAVAEDEAAE